MEDSAQQVALMRYRIIAPFLDPKFCGGTKKEMYNRLANTIYTHPVTQKQVQFRPETIRGWLKIYKKTGFDGLKSKSRSDKEKVKAIAEGLLQDAINLKLEHPGRTIDAIIAILERAGKAQKGEIKRSTLHRAFQKRKLNIRKLKSTAVFGRFEAEMANDVWQSDIMFGPKLPDLDNSGKFFTPQLVAFIDDHSRLILHAQFYYHGKTHHLTHCFRKAIQKRGIPKLVYVDNGAVFSSLHFESICAYLGIRLKFTRPYSPEGKGKIEKFFSYVRSSFLVEVEATRIQTLDQLNQAFFAWVEMHYHRKIHDGIQESPLDRFSRHLSSLKSAAEDVLELAFMIKEKRKVAKDCTFKLLSTVYEVMPALVHQEITLHYHPDNFDSVRVFLAGEFFQVAHPIRISDHVLPKSQLPMPLQVTTSFNDLNELIKAHQSQKNDSVLGPEIVPVPSDNRFTATQFFAILADHSLYPDDIEKRSIKKFFDDFGPIHNPFAQKMLQTTLNRVGTSKHISFYLDILKQGHSHAA